MLFLIVHVTRIVYAAGSLKEGVCKPVSTRVTHFK